MPRLSGAIVVSGTFDARGLASSRPVRGRVHAGALTTRYELELTDEAGAPLRLVGERKTKLSDPVFSSSTIRADLVDASGKKLAELVLRLDYRQRIARFLPL